MILDEICAHKREEVDAQKAARPLAELQEILKENKPVRDFRLALRKPGLSLIAEVKCASPSKGVFLKDFDPVTLADLYERTGARAISVLTDERYFKGSLAHLKSVRTHVSLPCLRKEFIIDEYQIYESRAAGADAILLIVRILSDEQLRDYLQLAASLDLASLVEVHTAEEVDRALACGAGIIGINNRDLSTFETNLDVTMDLKRRVPGGHVLVSESGISTAEDARRLEQGGIDAILVGEALVGSNDVAAKARELLSRVSH
jgi:indole-3-glycerol phosphate synthase